MGRKWGVVLGVAAALILFAGVFQNVLAADKTVKIKVPGCVCDDTEVMVRSTLQHSKGVKSVQTNPISGTYTVVYDDTKTDYDQLKRALQQAGVPPVGRPEYVN